MNSLDAEAIIATLALAPHPEGGWYRETFRDTPASGGRGALTQIYYLLRQGEPLALAPSGRVRGLALLRRRAAGATCCRA
jgi:predicted cupin superfamily sugar epimerase